jgi:hypothetical protein
VLKKLGVRAAELCPLAFYVKDSGQYYVPALLSAVPATRHKPGTDRYTFRFHSPRPVRYTAFSIQDLRDKPVYRDNTGTTQPTNDASYSWNGRQQKGKAVCRKGLYRASLQYSIPSFGGDEQGIVEVAFVHDPAFLGVAGCPTSR